MPPKEGTRRRSSDLSSYNQRRILQGSYGRRKWIVSWFSTLVNACLVRVLDAVRGIRRRGRRRRGAGSPSERRLHRLHRRPPPPNSQGTLRLIPRPRSSPNACSCVFLLRGEDKQAMRIQSPKKKSMRKDNENPVAEEKDTCIYLNM